MLGTLCQYVSWAHICTTLVHSPDGGQKERGDLASCRLRRAVLEMEIARSRSAGSLFIPSLCLVEC